MVEAKQESAPEYQASYQTLKNLLGEDEIKVISNTHEKFVIQLNPPYPRSRFAQETICLSRTIPLTAEESIVNFQETILLSPKGACNYTLSFRTNFGIWRQFQRTVTFEDPKHPKETLREVVENRACNYVGILNRTLVESAEPPATQPVTEA